MCILFFFLILRDFDGNKYFLSSIILLGGNYLFFLFRIEYYPRFLTNPSNFSCQKINNNSKILVEFNGRYHQTVDFKFQRREISYASNGK